MYLHCSCSTQCHVDLSGGTLLPRGHVYCPGDTFTARALTHAQLRADIRVRTRCIITAYT